MSLTLQNYYFAGLPPKVSRKNRYSGFFSQEKKYRRGDFSRNSILENFFSIGQALALERQRGEERGEQLGVTLARRRTRTGCGSTYILQQLF
jgi:hypothetical protein